MDNDTSNSNKIISISKIRKKPEKQKTIKKIENILDRAKPTAEKNSVQENYAGETKDQSKNRSTPFLNQFIITTSVLLFMVIGIYFGYRFFSEGKADATPTGRITLPLPGSTTDKQVRVSGYTKNLPSGSDYVWLVVDKPGIGLCWPKKPQIGPNCSFATVIDENGPKESYLLSLYAVNKSMNDAFSQWFDEARFGGLPMLPESRRLDTVRLWLGG